MYETRYAVGQFFRSGSIIKALHNFLSDAVSLALKFNGQLDSSIWNEKLLMFSSRIMLDSDVVYNGLSRGLELGSQSQLGLPPEQSFNYRHMTTFIANAKIEKPFEVVL